MQTRAVGSRVRSLLVIAASLVLTIVVAAGALLVYMTAMPGASYGGMLPAADADEQALAQRLRRHVAAIASVEHNTDEYAALDAAARYIETQLAGHGYKVWRQQFDSRAGKVHNLAVSIASRRQNDPAHPVLVVGAHYDSAEGTPGANDNASGSAAVLELARRLKTLAGATDHEIILVLYANEEQPYFKTELMGSRVHAAEMKASGKNVVAMVSIETIGYFADAPGSQRYPFPFNLIYPDRGNFIGFVGDLGSRTLIRDLIGRFRAHALFPSDGVAAPAFIPGIDWSDHWAYRQEDYPALMITDTAPYRYPHYHTEHDTVDKLDFDRMAKVVKGIEAMLRDYLGAR